MEYNVPAIIVQVEQAQKRVADLEIMFHRAKPQHQIAGCDSCANIIEDIKITLDGVFTNLKDLIGDTGVPQSKAWDVSLESFTVEATTEDAAHEAGEKVIASGQVWIDSVDSNE
jgi:hypothetical protein